MLKVANISFSYQSTPVIEEISFDLEAGKILAIAGESGSGKSTLLKLIYGQYDLNQGAISWQGNEILGPKFNLIPGPDFIKMVSQEFDLMPFTDVAQNVGTFLSNFNLKEKAARTAELLEVVGLTPYAKTKVKYLSGGQKQRVALAKALAKQPTILLLDEPFSHIDNLKKNELRKHVFDYIRKEKITAIIASHDKCDVISHADYMLFIDAGRTLAYKSPQALYQDPQTALIASFFDEFSRIDEAQNSEDRTPTELIIYPHEIKLAHQSELEATVLHSFFRGDHWLIEAEHEGTILKFRHDKSIEPATRIYLNIDDQALERRIY
ncbi:ABC transporter ATP-binding protein [Flavobacteriaceae bacterium F08102]|nr:ABC transporter ATP-binding protein [Flavobacteriaceae bacterium F08102]